MIDRQSATRNASTEEGLALQAALADLYVETGRFEEAERLHRQVLATSEQVLVEGHRVALGSMNSLAVVYRRIGRYASAESLCVVALARERLGRYAEAESLFLKVLELRRRTLGEDHPRVVQTMQNLAQMLEEQRRYDAAERLYRETLDLRIRVHGEETPFVGFDLTRLGRCLVAAGRAGEAEPILARAVELQRRNATRPGSLAFTLHEYGRCLLERGSFVGAETALLEAHTVALEELGADDEWTARTIMSVSQLYDRWGKEAEQARWAGMLGDPAAAP